MCEISATTALLISGAVAAGQVALQYQSAKQQVKAIEAQNEIEARQIADAAGVEMQERARAARRERAAARAAASEAGINLGSNSFLAALNTSLLNQSMDQALIERNTKNRQAARQAGANAAASRVDMPSALSAALRIGGAVYETHLGTQRARQAGLQAGGGVKPPKKK